MGTMTLGNDRLTIHPGENRAVVIEGSLHVIGSVTVDGTPADGQGVTNLGKKLERCEADQASLQEDHSVLQAHVMALEKRMKTLEQTVAEQTSH